VRRWGTNTYIVAQSIGLTDIAGEENGTVRVGKGRGRRIHVSNQRVLVSKSEKVEERIEVRGSSCQISTRTRARSYAQTVVSCKAMDWLRGRGKCTKQSSSINPTQSGNNAQLLNLGESTRAADRRKSNHEPSTSARSFARRASNMGGDALRSISGLQVYQGRGKSRGLGWLMEDQWG